MVILVISVIIILVINNKNLRESNSIYDNNFKALNLEKDSLNKAVIAYRFSVEQLEYINDSIIEDLNKVCIDYYK